MAQSDNRHYRHHIAAMELHMQRHWELIMRERRERERIDRERQWRSDRVTIRIERDYASNRVRVWPSGGGAGSAFWFDELDWASSPAPSRYHHRSQAELNPHPELTAALLGELKDMKQRMPGMWHWDIQRANYHDQDGFVQRDRNVRAGLKEPALERRYELARRCWATARGDFGPYQVELRQHDSDGILYEIVRCPARLLLVTCPSMKKPHVLFVPVTMRTAKEARAWTFGMTAEEFDVGSET